MADTLERYLRDLEDPDKPVASSKLATLSGLTGAELALFQKSWARLEAGRRRQVAAKLVEVSQANLQLDLDDVFLTCLEDPDREVRLLALDGLEGSESRSLLTPLIAHLRGDGEAAVRARAASVLGGFVLLAELEELPQGAARRVEEALLAVVREGREPLEVRRRAVEGLGPLSKESVRQVIREAYASPDPGMRPARFTPWGATAIRAGCRS